MNELDRRWRRLVAAACRTPSPEPAPLSAASVERLARRGLAARAATGRREPRRSERWAWVGWIALAAASALLLVPARSTVQQQAALLTRELAQLPAQVPAAPDLPAPFHLPPAPEALALLPDGPGVRAALGIPSSLEATP